MVKWINGAPQEMGTKSNKPDSRTRLDKAVLNLSALHFWEEFEDFLKKFSLSEATTDCFELVSSFIYAYLSLS